MKDKEMLEFIDFMGRMMLGEKDVLESKEKEGQDELIRRELLPKDMFPEKEVWEELGFKFSEIGDDLMYRGELPDGWKIRKTEHHMWSEIHDQEDNVRGTIFYKAAFYDRKANMSLKQKYDIKEEYNYNSDSVKHIFYFGNESERLYTSSEVEIFDEDFDKNPDLCQMLLDDAKESVRSFADTNYPDWNNVKNYWSKEKGKVKVKTK